MAKKRSASSRSAAHDTTKKRGTEPRKLTGEEFDALHDSGSDEIDRYINWDKARRPGRQIQRVNVDFPVDMLSAIDREATRHGVPRQAYIKMMIAGALPGWREKKPAQDIKNAPPDKS